MTLPTPLIAILIALAALTIGHWLATRHFKKAGMLVFKRRQFLTPNEVEFYHRLTAATEGKVIVMAQVSMAALIDNQLNKNTNQYWEIRQKYSGKICDFVLCDPKTLVPLVVVELDDVTHDFDKDKHRDNFLAQAGLRTLRFWSRKKPSIATLKDLIAPYVPKL